jgi:PAS domain-containing protein
MGRPKRTGQQALREREAELARVQRIGRVGGFEIDLRHGHFSNRRSPEYPSIHELPPDAVEEANDDWVRRLIPTIASGLRRISRPVLPAARWPTPRNTGSSFRAKAYVGSPPQVKLSVFMRLTARGRFTSVSRRALEAWHVTAEDVLGRRPDEVFPGVSEDATYQAVKQSMHTGKHVRTEAPASILGGRWVEQEAYPTADGGIAVVFRDIQDRKQIEIALKESERRLRDLNVELERLANERARQLASRRAQLQAFFDNSPDWLTPQRCTPDGRFIYVDINPTCEAAYGRARDEVVGRTVEEILRFEAAQLPISENACAPVSRNATLPTAPWLVSPERSTSYRPWYLARATPATASS